MSFTVCRDGDVYEGERPIADTWDGAVLPIGLGLSLVMNAIFFAKFINEMEVLTLADVYARKFGPAVEVIE